MRTEIFDNKRDWFLAVIYGLMIPLVVISLDSMQMKFMVGGVMAMTGLFIIAPVADKENVLLMLLGAFACVKLEKNFFISHTFLKMNTTAAGFSISFADILLAGLYCFWLRRWLKQPRPVDRRLFTYYILYTVFLMLALFSIVNAQHPILVLYEFKKRLEALFLIIYLTINIRSVETFKRFIGMLFLGVVISSFVAILQYKTGHNLGLAIFGEAEDYLNQTVEGSAEVIHRVSGLMQHSNIFGMYLCLLLPIAFSLSFSDISKKFKYYAFAVFVIGCVGLTLTFSRAALTSCFIGILTLVVVRNKSLFSRYNHVVLVMCSVLFLGVIIGFGGKVLDRFTSTPSANMSYRYMLNEAGFKMIERHPFMGVGLNNFSTQLQFYDVHGIVAHARFPAHNIYVLVAAETGLITLAVLLIFIALIMACGIRAYRRSEDIFVKNYSLGAMCGIIAVLFQSMVDFSMLVQVFYSLFFIISSLMIAARYNFTGPAYE